MAAPSSGIFAGPQAPSFGPVQDAFYAAAKATRRLRFCNPNRFKGLQHQCDVDGLNRRPVYNMCLAYLPLVDAKAPCRRSTIS